MLQKLISLPDLLSSNLLNIQGYHSLTYLPVQTLKVSEIPIDPTLTPLNS